MTERWSFTQFRPQSMRFHSKANLRIVAKDLHLKGGMWGTLIVGTAGLMG